MNLDIDGLDQMFSNRVCYSIQLSELFKIQTPLSNIVRKKKILNWNHIDQVCVVPEIYKCSISYLLQIIIIIVRKDTKV